MALKRNDGEGDAGRGERDSLLDRAYGTLPRVEPPERLDAAIRAAARREAGSRPRSLPSRLRSWRVPLSVAAVVIVSATLATLMGEEGGEALLHPGADAVPAPATGQRQASPAPGAEQPAPVSPPAAEERAPARRLAERDAQGDSASSGSRVPSSGKVAEAAKAQPAAPDSELSRTPGQRAGSVAADEAPVQEGEGPAAQAPERRGRAPASAPAASAARAMEQQRSGPPSGAMRSPAGDDGLPAQAESGRRSDLPASGARLAALITEFESQPPGKWLERIVELRRQGKTAEADGMLAEFRRRYPAHTLPAGVQ